MEFPPVWCCHGVRRAGLLATLVYEGVVAYVRGGECPARQIRDPVTDLIVTRHDEATPLTVEGVAYGEAGVAAVTVFREVWWL